MSCVDQTDFHSSGFKDLEDRDPIDTGAFHGHGANTASHQPVGQGVEIFGKGGKATNRIRIAIGWNSHVESRRTDIDSCGIGVNDRLALLTGFVAARRSFS